MAQEHGWNPEIQGWILSSFFIGYLLTQVLGGRLADRYGGTRVLAAGVLIWSLFTLLTPLSVTGGLVGLLACRIAMGLGEGVAFPAIFSLLTRWIPPSERSRAASLNTSGIPLGTVGGLLITPVIVARFGWEWAFYSFGLLGFVWFALWAWKVRPTPQEHPTISAEEIALITEQASAPGAAGTPWLKLVRSRAVWAIVVAHTCGNWTTYVLLAWLPTYVNQELGVDFESIGLLSMLPSAASFLALNVFGSVADRVTKPGANLTHSRKGFQSLSLFGLAAALLLVPTVESAWAAIGIMSAGAFLSGAGAGGILVNFMDISPRHTGSLMGFSNTFATLPGIFGVVITGMILDATGSWALVFQVAAAIAAFGGLVYLLFASAEKQFD